MPCWKYDIGNTSHANKSPSHCQINVDSLRNMPGQAPRHIPLAHCPASLWPLWSTSGMNHHWLTQNGTTQLHNPAGSREAFMSFMLPIMVPQRTGSLCCCYWLLYNWTILAAACRAMDSPLSMQDIDTAGGHRFPPSMRNIGTGSGALPACACQTLGTVRVPSSSRTCHTLCDSYWPLACSCMCDGQCSSGCLDTLDSELQLMPPSSS